jgi:hypothetical protein
MTIHAFSSWPHYCDHIAPIWDHLPREDKGQFVVTSKPLQARMANRGIETVLSRANGRIAEALKDRNPILVAGYSDLTKQHKRPIAFLEHGAGQTYVQHDGRIHGGYAGGRNRAKVGLFLCPNNKVAKLNLDAYPNARVAVVGSPRLDDLYEYRIESVREEKMCVGITFHWDCQIAVESGSAFSYYADQIKEFVKYAQVCDIEVLGHGHPKAWPWLASWWRDQGVEPVSDWGQMVRRIDTLVVDNSSVMFEAAALQIGVVVLESPEWRKDVNHGLRFWEYADLGPTVLPGGDLSYALWETYEHEWQVRREQIVGSVYGIQPGLDRLASRSATEALLEWAEQQ